MALSGCILGDEDYAVATEQYSLGWMLHNINDSTSTDITYSINDLAIYNYSYDYPADKPYDFYNYFSYLTPVPRNMTEETIIIGNLIAVPLNRTYYVMGSIPSPENYKTNWSFYNDMEINYISSYLFSHYERYNSTNPFYSITPLPGDSISISFGKAPYTPTSFLVNNQSITLSNYLLRGYIPKAFLWRDTAMFNINLIPTYQIYLNDSLVYSANITDINGIWDHTALNYSFESNGTYFVNITIPSNYPVWNIIRLETVFHIPSSDVQPPVLNHIEANPYFEYNKPYSISINVTDNFEIKNISAYYMENSVWIPLDLYNNSGLFETNITITNISVNSFDFMILVNDTSDNQIKYIIQPLALIGKNVFLTVQLYSTNLVQGGYTSVRGTVKVNNTNIPGFMIEIFLNDSKIGNALSGYEGYSTNIKLPCNSLPNQNITAKFRGTGVYMGNETFNETTINFVPLNFTVNDTIPIHTKSIINASGYGAYIIINKSSWSYGDYMDSNYFYFTPHHYGNYTITLNTSCGENISKTVFSNITLPPSIEYIDFYPYLLSGRDFYIYVSTYSQENHNLIGKLNNSSTNINLNFTFQSYPYYDRYTGELYNYSYCDYCWLSNVNNLPSGIYNLSLEISDVINQKDSKNEIIYVFPEMNITFNITDFNGNPVNRKLYIGFDSSYYNYFYTVNGYKNLELIPNRSYFNKTFHISIINYTDDDYQLIRFINSTILGNISMISDYFENKTEYPDKILYSTHFYNTSWGYEKIYVNFIYYNSSRFGMHNANRATLYACKSYNFSQKKCSTDWINITSGKFVYGPYVDIYGIMEDPQALSFGEPLYCGDNYCSSYENCSSCAIDCICLGGMICQNGICVTPNYGCGNTTCDLGENCTSCPADCGCPEGQICEDGICKISKDTQGSVYQGNQTENTTQSSQTNVSLNVSQNESNLNGYKSTLPQLETCPFECCNNETIYTVKLCNSTSECINNKCVIKKNIIIFDYNTILIIATFGLSTITIFIILYFKFLKKREAPNSKLFPKEIKYENLNAQLEELSKEISMLKNSYDTSQLENELNLARFALQKGLKETAAYHIENMQKMKKSLSQS
ncbi:MAG: hypothetical protein QW076_03505 [Candidatus Anstonellales archaeon]